MEGLKLKFALRLNPLPAVLILVAIKLLGVVVALGIFAHYTPLVDAEMYLSGAYSKTDNVRTSFVQLLVDSLRWTGSPIFIHACFGLVSIFGIAYYFVRGGRQLLVLVPLVLPSALIWTSVISKESLFYGAFSLGIVIWSRYLSGKGDRIDFFFLTLSFFLALTLRPHYTLALGWLFFSVVMLRRLGRHSKFLIIFFASILILIIAVFIWDDLLARGFGAIDPRGRASRFGDLSIEPGSDSGLASFKTLLPWGLIIGIIGPTLSEVAVRPEFTPFFVEGLIILSSPLIIYFVARRCLTSNYSRFKCIFLWSLFPSILLLLIMHAPFGILNPGSAIRWRVNFEAALTLAPLLLYYSIRDKNEDNSFPH